MNKNIVYTCYIFALFVISCSENNRQNELTDIIIEENSQSRSLLDFFEFSHIIPLETNDENYILNIKKIYINSLGIFIQDENTRILVFDSEGKYIRQFKYLGKGPGEWINIYDFEVNCSDSTIVIRSQFKELTYNLKGNLIHEKMLDIEEKSNYYVRLNKSTIILYSIFGDNNFDITIQTEGKRNKYLLKRINALTGHLFTRQYSRNFCQTSQGNYFIRSFDNTIYKVDSINHLTPRFKIDFGKKNYPNGKKLKPENIPELDKKYANYISSIYENEVYLYFTYKEGNFPQNIIYDKELNKVIFKSTVYFDQINNLPLNLINYYGDVNNALSILEPEFYKYFMEVNEMKIIKFNELSQLKETDNPVLVFYEFKSKLN